MLVINCLKEQMKLRVNMQKHVLRQLKKSVCLILIYGPKCKKPMAGIRNFYGLWQSELKIHASHKFSHLYTLLFWCYRDGLHLTVDGNAVVYQELIKVFNEAGLSADNMPFDFPDYSEIDHKNPQTSFQQ